MFSLHKSYFLMCFFFLSNNSPYLFMRNIKFSQGAFSQLPELLPNSLILQLLICSGVSNLISNSKKSPTGNYVFNIRGNFRTFFCAFASSSLKREGFVFVKNIRISSTESWPQEPKTFFFQERPFVCDECGKRFKTRHCVNIHLRSHGIGGYSWCDLGVRNLCCGSAFLDPESSAVLTPGYGIRDKFFSGSRIPDPTQIFEILVTIFLVKNTYIFCHLT